MNKIFLSVLIIVTCALSLSAETVKIAILDFTKTGISAAENTDLNEFIRKELGEKPNSTVISRDEMNKIFTSAKFNPGGCADIDCANESAAILKADYVIYGIIIKTGIKYSVTVGSYNVKSRDQSFTERFETDIPNIIKKKLRDFTDKMSLSFPKQETKIDPYENNGRPYNLKYVLGLNTAYMITSGKLFYGDIPYKSSAFHFLTSGIKFQVEILNSWKFGVIGEFEYPLTPFAGLNPYWGSGGIIISWTKGLIKKILFVNIDAAILGGSYSPNVPFANLSPRLSMVVFPVSIFGIEFSYCYNFYFGLIPDSQTLGINFIFKF